MNFVAPVLGIPRTSQNLQTLAIFNGSLAYITPLAVPASEAVDIAGTQPRRVEVTAWPLEQQHAEAGERNR